MSIVEVQNLVREFRIHGKAEGSFRLLKQLFNQGGEAKRVVDGVSFSLEKGDFVGYLGPNGAGKSTTIKMLSGVLVPTSGRVSVLGLEPHRHRRANAMQIGVVFGQRTQLWWDLPLAESFKLIAKIYEVPEERYRRNLALFTEVLGMESFLNTPVRQLSLGQRMRGDIAAALLHDPQLLFLDEPTIGLDVLAKERIQAFLREINRDKQVTVILTTHNMDDIEKLCKRVIFIDEGKVLFDGSSQEMVGAFGDHKYLMVETDADWNRKPWRGPAFTRSEGAQLWFRIRDDKEIAPLVREITEYAPIHNLRVEEPKIEDVVKRLYARTEGARPQAADKS